MVVPVSLTIRGNVYELRPRSSIRKPALQASSKLLSAVQQLLKGHCLRDRPVVEKQADIAAGRKLGQICAGGIDAPGAHIFPAPSTQFACPARLARGQYCELDAQLGKDIQRF